MAKLTPYRSANGRLVSQNASLFRACGLPWEPASNLPYPRPLRVFTHTAVGTFPGFSACSVSVNTRVMASQLSPCSVPATRHPWEPNQSTGVP